MGRSQRRKGDGYERHVAKLLSQWWYGRDDVLRKTPRSGGWSKRHATAFDLIVAIGEVEAFPFGVDAKWWESWSFDHLLCLEDGGDIGRWWRKLVRSDIKAVEDATGKRYRPMLVFKRSFGPDLYAIEHEVADRLKVGGRRIVVESNSSGKVMAIGLLDDLLATDPNREAVT